MELRNRDLSCSVRTKGVAPGNSVDEWKVSCKKDSPDDTHASASRIITSPEDVSGESQRFVSTP